MMRRLTVILATTLLASSLLASAAEARGGGGHIGGFAGGAHFGGLGGGEHPGGIGGGMTGHVGVDGRRGALGHRLEEGESLGCSESNLLHPGQPLSPGCG